MGELSKNIIFLIVYECLLPVRSQLHSTSNAFRLKAPKYWNCMKHWNLDVLFSTCDFQINSPFRAGLCNQRICCLLQNFRFFMPHVMFILMLFYVAWLFLVCERKWKNLCHSHVVLALGLPKWTQKTVKWQHCPSQKCRFLSILWEKAFKWIFTIFMGIFM